MVIQFIIHIFIPSIVSQKGISYILCILLRRSWFEGKYFYIHKHTLTFDYVFKFL